MHQTLTLAEIHGAGQRLAVGAEGDCFREVPAEGMDFPAARRIPHDHTVEGGAGQALTIRAEADVIDARRDRPSQRVMPLEGEGLSTGG